MATSLRTAGGAPEALTPSSNVSEDLGPLLPGCLGAWVEAPGPGLTYLSSLCSQHLRLQLCLLFLSTFILS